MTERILVLDDEESILFTFETFLSDEGYSVSTAAAFDEALRKISEMHFDLVFADAILEGRSGVEFIQELRRRNLRTPVVIMTGAPNVETVSEAVRLGAFDYLIKPVMQEKLLSVSRAALRIKESDIQKEWYHTGLDDRFGNIKGTTGTVEKTAIGIDSGVLDMWTNSRGGMEAHPLKRTVLSNELGEPSRA